MTHSPGDETLRQQYDRAVAEYRFQVDLNWRRSEYFFVLNVGVLIAAATMFSSASVPKVLVGVLFLVGALLASLSFLANDVQSGYYKSARNLKGTLEKELGLGDMALATTPGMGSAVARLGRVGTFLKIMLVAIALADLTGAAFAIDRAFSNGGGGEGRKTVVSIWIAADRSRQPSVLVVSRAGAVVAERRLTSGQRALAIMLLPGQYRVSVDGRTICENALRVEQRALQQIRLRC